MHAREFTIHMEQDAANPFQTSTPHKGLSLYQWLLWLVLFVSMLAQPNTFYLLFPPYQTIFSILLLVLTGVFIFRKFFSQNCTLFAPNILIWLAFYFIVSLASLVGAPDPMFGIRILASMLLKIILFLIIVDACTHLAHLRMVLVLFVLAGSVFALQGVLQFFLISSMELKPVELGIFAGMADQAELEARRFDYYGLLGFVRVYLSWGALRIPRVQSMFIEPGHFANFLETTFFSTLAYAFLFSKKRRVFFFLLAGLQFLALLLTFSVGGWASVGIALLFFGGHLALYKGTWKLFLRVLLSLLVVACIVVGSAAWFPDAWSAIQVSIEGKFNRRDTKAPSTSAALRSQSLLQAMSLAAERPILGWGPGQILVQTGDIQNNAFATALSEQGLLGLFLYSALVGSIFIALAESLRMVSKLSMPEWFLATLCIACLVIARLAHSMLINTNWNYSYLIGLALLYANHRILSRAFPQSLPSRLPDTSTVSRTQPISGTTHYSSQPGDV